MLVAKDTGSETGGWDTYEYQAFSAGSVRVSQSSWAITLAIASMPPSPLGEGLRTPHAPGHCEAGFLEGLEQ